MYLLYVSRLLSGILFALLPAGLHKVQVASIKFTHRLKIWFFAPEGQLISPTQVKLGMANGHMGLLGCAKFHLGAGVGIRPTKYQ